MVPIERSNGREKKSIIRTPPTLSKITKQVKTLTKSMPKSPYTPEIAAMYQKNYYYLHTVTNSLQSHVGAEHFPLFVQQFVQSPNIRIHLPATPAPVTTTPPIAPPSTNLVQTALTLKNNIVDMVHSLPSKSHFRLQLLSGVVLELSTSTCTDLFNSSAKTIQCARKLDFKETEIATRKYAPNTTRRRMSQEEINWILLFVIEICPTPSGYTIEIYLQTIERKEFYALYCARVAFHNANNALQFDTRSERVFFRISHILHIRRLRKYWGWSKCLYCSGEKKMPEDHIHSKNHQRQTYRDTHLNLKQNEILWTWDFSDFHTAISKGETITIRDMIIVREWIVFKNDAMFDRSDLEEDNIIYEDENAIRFRKYIDAVCSDKDTNSNDSYYFINVLEQLFEEGFFEKDKYNYI